MLGRSHPSRDYLQMLVKPEDSIKRNKDETGKSDHFKFLPLQASIIYIRSLDRPPPKKKEIDKSRKRMFPRIQHTDC